VRFLTTGSASGNERAKFDVLGNPTLTAVTDDEDQNIRRLRVDPETNALLVSVGEIGEGIPGGNDTWIQFNNEGAFGGSANFTYNKSTTVVLTGTNSTANAQTINGIYVYPTLSGANSDGAGHNSLGIASVPTMSGALTAGSNHTQYGMFSNPIFSGTTDNSGSVITMTGTLSTPSWQGTIGSNDILTTYGFYTTPTENLGTTGTTAKYGIYSVVSGTADKSYAGYFSASGATNNYAAIFSAGNVGIGDTTPTALLTVGNGDLFQVSSAGAVVIGAGTSITKHLSATATLDFADQTSAGCEVLTITVTGAAVGDTVAIGVPNASDTANSTFYGWVSATNTVSVKHCAVVSGNPASGTFRADVWQH
jgi:hypothetical protein